MLSEFLPGLLCFAVPIQGTLGTDGPAPPSIVIGSKNFTESHLLGEIMTQFLAQHDYSVEHRSSLGGTLVCFEALRSGSIDLYPDYTGTGWSIVLKEEQRITDPLQTYLHVQSEYRQRYDLEWLKPFGLNNTYALAMSEERAEELGVQRISDLVTVADQLRVGFSVEFMNREDGYPGLSSFYGLRFDDVKALEHGLAYEAIASGTIDLIDAYSTDGKLIRYALRVLEDDRSFFPPYDAAPIVRGELLREHPQLHELIDDLGFRLTDARMMELNHRVEEQGHGFEEVAHSFLLEQGLLKEGVQLSGEHSNGRRADFLSFFVGRWRTTLGLLWEHLLLTLSAVLLAAAVAIPLGILATRYAPLERAALGAAAVLQTIPSLALLAFMIAVPGLGLSARSAIAALFLYALLPILRNTVTGIRSVDPELVDAARGLGLTPRQILLRIQLPMATRTVMAGLRTATVISIGVATLAAFIGAGGLGEPIVTGLYLNDAKLILAGAIPAALLAVAADQLLGRLELALTPRALR